MDIIHIDASVGWLVTKTDGGYHVAYCQALAMVTQGETWSELTENISDALDLLFMSLLKEGDIGAFFREKGWIEPAGIEDGARIDLPFTLEQVSPHEYSTAALH